ncbi:hypothetical protein BDW_07930 [Bdellovibrio bacteriovorus W]|nr:hypothetical protein BDW_07930 [Bdellovibrio bacteriovorus W]
MHQIYFVGTVEIPKHFKSNKTMQCHLMENPYELRTKLGESQGEKILVVHLPFIESRHLDMYGFLQKTIPQLKTFFIAEELSHNIKNRLKNSEDFIVLWKTEEKNLMADVEAYLEGRAVHLRENKREEHDKRPMISPSMLPLGALNKDFQPILGGEFDNISSEGSCIQIQAPFYQKKDFINLSYQSKEGDYIQVEGQVRWTRWDDKEQKQHLGIQFLTRP